MCASPDLGEDLGDTKHRQGKQLARWHGEGCHSSNTRSIASSWQHGRCALMPQEGLSWMANVWSSRFARRPVA